jgi:uncharacterized membrane protein (DUF106 family)
MRRGRGFMGVLLYLFFVIIGYLFLYVVVKAAIDHSIMSRFSSEINALRNQKNQEIDILNRQLEELKKLMIEQNELTKEQLMR